MLVGLFNSCYSRLEKSMTPYILDQLKVLLMPVSEVQPATHSQAYLFP